MSFRYALQTTICFVTELRGTGVSIICMSVCVNIVKCYLLTAMITSLMGLDPLQTKGTVSFKQFLKTILLSLS